MALTKIKTGGITDSAITTAKINDDAVTDAKVADAITVTGAQTGITSVGTLGSTSISTSSAQTALSVTSSQNVGNKRGASFIMGGSNAGMDFAIFADAGSNVTSGSVIKGISRHASFTGELLTLDCDTSASGATLINAKDAGTSKFKVLSTGDTTIAGNVDVVGRGNFDKIRIGGSGDPQYSRTMQVDGDIIMFDDGGNPELLIGDDGSNYGKLSWNSTGNYISIGGGQGTENIALVPSGGSVGIGTTNPSSKLQVEDTSTTISHLSIASNTTAFAPSSNSGLVSISNNAAGTTGALLLIHQESSSTGATVPMFKITKTSSNTEFFRVQYDGKVGIGVTDPDEKLEVAGHLHLTGRLDFWSEGGSSARTAYIGDSGSIGISGGEARDLEMKLIKGLHIGTNNAATSRFYLKSDGNVGIGNASPTGNLEVRSAASSHCIVTVNTTDANYDASIILEEAGSEKWNIMNDADGHSGGSNSFVIRDRSDSSTAVHIAPGGTSFVSGSDERLKKDINNIGSVLDGINSLRPITYKRKYGILDITHPGLIAQEVKPHFPLTVLGEEDSFREISENEAEGGLSLAYQDLIPYLIKAVQELSAKVEALENA